MRVLNYGSLNVDYTYSVPHIVEAGETILSSNLEMFCGGKGLNQSIALSRAGLPVAHAGIIGYDGDILLQACEKEGIDTTFIKRMDVRGGHTVIQVDEESGQNCIILYGGTNMMQKEEYIDEALASFCASDCLMLQNEVNLLDYIIDRAYEKGMKIVLNPSPYNDKLNECDLMKVSLFLVNEIEAFQITGRTDPDQVLDILHEKFPRAGFVLTLGMEGAWYYDGKQKVFQGIFEVDAVDTTAAGDTFTGFFIEEILNGGSVERALKVAAKASSIAVTRKGAAPSIPSINEVMDSLLENSEI